MSDLWSLTFVVHHAVTLILAVSVLRYGVGFYFVVCETRRSFERVLWNKREKKKHTNERNPLRARSFEEAPCSRARARRREGPFVYRVSLWRS